MPSMDSGRAVTPSVDVFGLIHAVHRAVKVSQVRDTLGDVDSLHYPPS